MCEEFVKTYEADAYFRKDNLLNGRVYRGKMTILECKCGRLWVKPFHEKRKDYIEAVRDFTE